MNEDAIEQLCLTWLAKLGWAYVHGPQLLPAEVGSGSNKNKGLRWIDAVALFCLVTYW